MADPGLVHLATQKATQYGVPPKLGLAVIRAESNWNPQAHSPAGAQGLMQLMPGTARGLGVHNAFDPAQNIDGGMRYLGHLYKQFGDPRLALAAYNAGPMAVIQHGNKVPPYAETQAYVDKIMADIGGPGALAPGAASSPPVSAPQRSHPALSATPTPGFHSPDYGALRQTALYSIALGGSPESALRTFSTASDALRQKVQAFPNARMPNAQPGAVVDPASPTGRGTRYMRPSGLAGGFLPKGASYTVGRVDAGHDFQTDPGAPIIAPGAGKVVAVKYNPGGFGPAYPVVHFTSGPYKGQTLYIGHTISALKPGQLFKPGQVLSRTGRTPVGNASVPGWAEIGFADASGTPGHMGQTPPF